MTRERCRTGSPGEATPIKVWNPREALERRQKLTRRGAQINPGRGAGREVRASGTGGAPVNPGEVQDQEGAPVGAPRAEPKLTRERCRTGSPRRGNPN